jgi:hypothetical protein
MLSLITTLTTSETDGQAPFDDVETVISAYPAAISADDGMYVTAVSVLFGLNVPPAFQVIEEAFENTAFNNVDGLLAQTVLSDPALTVGRLSLYTGTFWNTEGHVAPVKPSLISIENEPSTGEK